MISIIKIFLKDLTRPSWHFFWGAYCEARNSPHLGIILLRNPKDNPRRQIRILAARQLVHTSLGRLILFALLPYKLTIRIGRVFPCATTGILTRVRSSFDSVIDDIDHNTWRKNDLSNREKTVRDGYLSHEAICTLLANLNRGVDSDFLDNKTRFQKFCADAGLPSPPIVWRSNDSFGAESESITLSNEDIFIKYEDGVCGTGAERWEFDPITEDWSRNGIRHDSASLISHLDRLSAGGRIIVQQSLRNHPNLIPYSNGALATLRVVTARPRNEVEPVVIACCLRMPTGGSEVDNFAVGGLAAAVALDGLVLSAVVKTTPRIRYNSHPDSGFEFTGTRLPMFDEAISLCLRAHGMITRPHFIGWDVAFLNSGPTLLEANTIWCVDLIQMSHQRPISDFGFAEMYMSCFNSAK